MTFTRSNVFIFITIFIFPFMFVSISAAQSSEKSKLSSYINSLKGQASNEKNVKIQQYLKELSDDEFLSLSNEMSQDVTSPYQGAVFFSHLKNRWRNNPPVNKLLFEIKSKQKHKYYRISLINYLTNNSKKRMRKSTKNKQALDDLETIIEGYRTIIADKSNDSDLRATVTSDTASILGMSREYGMLSDGKKIEHGDFFLTKLKDIDEDEKVRGKAVKALRKLGDKRVLPILRDHIRKIQTNDILYTRMAIVNAAKMKDEQSENLIAQQVEHTDNSDIFRTGVYALGLYKKPTTLKHILNGRSRFDPAVTRSLLRGQMEIVENIFIEEDKKYLNDAIQSVEFAELKELKNYLHSYVNYPDKGVRLSAIKAILKIGNKGDLLRVIANTEAENDPDLLTLLEEVERESNLVFTRGINSNEPTANH